MKKFTFTLINVLLVMSFLISPAIVLGATAFSPAVTLPPEIVFSVPIKITNSQSSATPAPFQQMIKIDSVSFASHEANNLRNIEFFYSSGSIIPSWLESGASKSSHNTIYWLKIAAGIPGLATLKIYMGFAKTTVDLFNKKTTGEAPQISTIYGKYDDGANVFTVYDDFAGTTISSLWTVGPDIQYSVNNGLAILGSDNSNYAALYLKNYQANSQSVVEFYGTMRVPVVNDFEEFGVITSSSILDDNSGSFVQVSPNVASAEFGQQQSGCCSFTHTGPIVSGTNTGVWTVSIVSSSVSNYFFNYGHGQTDSGSAPSYPLNAGFKVGSGSPGVTQNADWARVRAFPPNYVMSSVVVA